jgi:hypothetical protein
LRVDPKREDASHEALLASLYIVLTRTTPGPASIVLGWDRRSRLERECFRSPVSS